MKTPREEAALTFGFLFESGQTFVLDVGTPFGFGPDENGNSTTSALLIGQEYVRRGDRGAWALRSQFSFGTGLFGATANDEPLPDGRFVVWLGQVQRVQAIGNNHLLIVQLDAQLTSDALLPQQQFVIGGGESVRGYRQNVLAGDGGIRFSVEDRITLIRNEADQSVFEVAPFFDAGYVFTAGNSPNGIPLDNTAIAGIGVGFLWSPTRNLELRFDYGVSLVDLDLEDDTNIQDDGLYFRAEYRF